MQVFGVWSALHRTAMQQRARVKFTERKAEAFHFAAVWALARVPLRRVTQVVTSNTAFRTVKSHEKPENGAKSRLERRGFSPETQPDFYDWICIAMFSDPDEVLAAAWRGFQFCCEKKLNCLIKNWLRHWVIISLIIFHEYMYVHVYVHARVHDCMLMNDNVHVHVL